MLFVGDVICWACLSLWRDDIHTSLLLFVAHLKT